MEAQSQANPWISERSLGSVRNALHYAEEAGVVRKVLSPLILDDTSASVMSSSAV